MMQLYEIQHHIDFSLLKSNECISKPYSKFVDTNSLGKSFAANEIREVTIMSTIY